MSVAVLFPGQGVQREAMLPWLDDAPAGAPVLARMAAAIGADWRHCLADPAWAERNDVAQCLMTGTSLASWDVLRGLGLPDPIAFAGYSVGELAAFSAAGVFDEAAALSLARARASAMDRSASGRDGGLLSVSGLPSAAIDAARARWSLEVAIRIAPDRCMLGGDNVALVAAAEGLSTQGANVTRLRMHVASHTSQMLSAVDDFAASIESMSWLAPQRVLIANRSGSAVRSVPEMKRCLAEQIAHTVQWQRCMEALAERRPSCVLEIGAGTSLSNFWRAAYPDIPSRSVDEFGSPDDAVVWVKSHL